MRASAPELYRARRAQLEAERQGLLAHLAQNRARFLLLEMERKYGVIATESTLDIHTGVIIPGEATGESDRDENTGAQRPSR